MSDELKAELDRVTRLYQILLDKSDKQLDYIEDLQAQVERLTKAGDAMVKRMRELDPIDEPAEEKVILDWNAAKEGKDL